MADVMPTRRRVRLPLAAYGEVGSVCSVTIAVKGRAPVFSDEAVAAASVAVLRERAAISAVPIYAYCVMPDHVHVVLGPSATCDIVTFVGEFKNLTLRASWRLGCRGSFWQTGFWDHFLRREEQLDAVVAYVLENPVRARLVERWQEYAHSGSMEFALRP